MNKFALKVMATVFAITFQLTVFAQSLSVNTDGSTAHPSALMDIKSTLKGLLIPRMSKTEKNTIPSPATGLLIFQNSPDSIGFYYFNGTGWQFINAATNSWLTTGNAGINSNNNFLGTTDVQSLRFRINNIFSGQLNDLTTYFGFKAGLTNPNIPHTIGIGSNALQNNTAANNIAIGDSSMFYNNAAGNMAIGHFTMRNNNSGNNNTAIGNSAMQSNTIGSDNTALGYFSLAVNSGGNRNTAIGAYALNANINATANTATGYGALYTNASGIENVANGYNSQFSNINGNQNTAVGAFSASDNTNGSSNVSLGYAANKQNVSGSYNVAIGVEAMYNSDASENVGIGYKALHVVKGNRNTAIGYHASTSITTGVNNTAVGFNAGFGYITGVNNTSLGAEAYSSLNNNNYMALGYEAGGNWSTSDNVVEIGNTFVTKIGGQVGWSIQSDKRIKNNIKADVPGLAFIKLLQPVTFNLDIARQTAISGRNIKTTFTPWNSMYDIEKIKMTGFLAQDVEAAAKSIGYDFSGVNIPKKTTDLYSIQYASFVVPLVKAVQEQQQLIENQQKTIDELKSINEELRDQNKSIIQRLIKLENK